MLSKTEPLETSALGENQAGDWEAVPPKSAELASRSLLGRRRFSLRFQIYTGFILIFLFALAIAIALMTTMYQVEDRLEFLEIVNDFMVEIQQARRFEKNFFLYGTNLNDALESVYQAEHIFETNSARLAQILDKTQQENLGTNIKRYEELLVLLTETDLKDQTGAGSSIATKDIEAELRKHGQKIFSSARDLMTREKAFVSEAMERSRRIHIFSLGFLFLFMAFNAYVLGNRILGGINRFVAYAQRIAAGDYSPITPRKRYSDEFTDLALAINQMINELENRESVLIQSHKMRAIGTLTAGVAHELNNPINNITLTAHMMLEDYDNLSDQERKEMVNDVAKEAERSKNIVSDLLDFARESSSQVEPLNVKELLQETIELASNQIKLSGIKIKLQATENLPRVHGDSQQLKQVFLNLILNAIDASPKHGKIEVLGIPADDPNFLAVKVIDYGYGIPEHILPSIFDPFFTTKGRGKGTGLGLSVSQGIIAKHGGKISVSSAEGKGTTFTVTLPITTIPTQLA